MSEETETFEGWAILELMGHRKLAGYVSTATIGGASMLRIDVPGHDPGKIEATQFYSPAALYCLTLVAETVARGMAARYQPAPVQRWELPPTIEGEGRRAGPWDDDEEDVAELELR